MSPIEDNVDLHNEFDEILLEVTNITYGEIDNVLNCFLYAFSPLYGDKVEDVDIINVLNGYKILIKWCSGNSKRSVPNFVEALNNGKKYIIEGTPIRATNLQGPNTKGTRLHQGLANANVKMWVR